MGFVVRLGLIGTTSRVVSKSEREKISSGDFGAIQKGLVSGILKPQVTETEASKISRGTRRTFTVTKPSGETVERTTITTPTTAGTELRFYETPTVRTVTAPTVDQTGTSIKGRDLFVELTPSGEVERDVLIRKDRKFVKTGLDIDQAQTLLGKSQVFRTMQELEFAGTGEISPGVKAPSRKKSFFQKTVDVVGSANKKTSMALEKASESKLGSAIIGAPSVLFQKEQPIQKISRKFMEITTPDQRMGLKLGLGRTASQIGFGRDVGRGIELEIKQKPISTAALFAGGFAFKIVGSGAKVLLTKSVLASAKSALVAQRILTAGRITGKVLGTGIGAVYAGGVTVKAITSPEPVGTTLGREAVKIGAIVGGFKTARGIKTIRNLDQQPITNIKNIGRSITTGVTKKGVTIDVTKDVQVARVAAGGKVKEFKIASITKGITRPDIDKAFLRSDITKINIKEMGITGKSAGKIVAKYQAEIRGVTKIKFDDKIGKGIGDFKVITQKKSELFARTGRSEFTVLRGEKIDRTFSNVFATKFKKVPVVDFSFPKGKVRGLKPFTKGIAESKVIARIVSPLKVYESKGLSIVSKKKFLRTVSVSRNVGLSSKDFDRLLSAGLRTGVKGKVAGRNHSDILQQLFTRNKRAIKTLSTSGIGRVSGAEIKFKPILKPFQPTTTSSFRLQGDIISRLVLPSTKVVSPVTTLFDVGKVGTISLLRSRSTTISLPSSVLDSRSVSKLKGLSATREITSPKELTGIKEINVVKEITSLKEIVSLKSLTSLRSVTGLRSLTSVRSITSVTSPVAITSPVVTTTGVPPPPINILFPIFAERKKKGKGKIPSRTFKFQPSLIATAKKIRGKKPKRITGLGLRPITKGFGIKL